MVAGVSTYRDFSLTLRAMLTSSYGEIFGMRCKALTLEGLITSSSQSRERLAAVTWIGSASRDPQFSEKELGRTCCPWPWSSAICNSVNNLRRFKQGETRSFSSRWQNSSTRRRHLCDGCGFAQL